MLNVSLGDDGMTEYEWRTNKPKDKNHGEPAAERKLSDDLKKHFRFYFPSEETVANSKGGLGVSLITMNLNFYLARALSSERALTCVVGGRHNMYPTSILQQRYLPTRANARLQKQPQAWNIDAQQNDICEAT